MTFGVYIHVPFCVSKCGYCDFCRVTDIGKQGEYLKALSNEMRQSDVVGLTPRTIYLGGGTPSSLGYEKMNLLLSDVENCFDVGKVEEFTVECNPDDVTDELVRTLVAHGVNRVSMGSQSLDDKMLKFMGRRHNAEQVVQAVEMFRKGGIENISVDCIFGLPKLEGYSFNDDIDRFLKLGVTHLSAYALSFEEGSLFSEKLKKGEITPLPDDEVADQYELLTSKLRNAGYQHYEISNYALPKKQAKHNSSYWNHVPYVGFGPSASSFDGQKRRTNTQDVNLYIEKNGINTAEEEILSPDDFYNETVMLSLRTSEGLKEESINPSYKQHFKEKISEEIKNENIVRQENGAYRIPENKWFVADAIIERLFV